MFLRETKSMANSGNVVLRLGDSAVEKRAGAKDKEAANDSGRIARSMVLGDELGLVALLSVLASSVTIELAAGLESAAALQSSSVVYSISLHTTN